MTKKELLLLSSCISALSSHPDAELKIHSLLPSLLTRCKECGVNPEVVMLWDGHEADKDVNASRVDRGYTDFSEEYLLKEAQKVEYDLE